MELVALLEALRANFLQEFDAAYHQQIEVNEHVFPEIAFEISGTVYKRLFVVDLVARNGEGDTAIEVGSTEAVLSGETYFQYNGLNIDFGNVSWDAMRFSLAPYPVEITGFEPWFDKWIDLNGERSVEGELLSSVIHSATIGDDIVDVDFGSSPVDAVLELFDLFKTNNVMTIQVSSSRE